MPQSSWDEAKHPREPSGDDEGGQFVTKAAAAARQAAGLGYGSFIPEDPSKYKNAGEYMDALPKYKEGTKGPAGQTIDVWYDRLSKNWVVIEHDLNGDQLQTYYCYTKHEAQQNAAMWQNDWWKP